MFYNIVFIMQGKCPFLKILQNDKISYNIGKREMREKMDWRIPRTLLIGIVLFVYCVACSANSDVQDDESLEEKVSFKATIVEANNGLMVSPLDGEDESRSADLISVGLTNDAILLDKDGNEITLSDFKEGMTVEITYDGVIMESYPAQIRSFQVQIIEEE